MKEKDIKKDPAPGEEQELETPIPQAEETDPSKEMEELEKLEKEYNELNDKYLRLMAEYDNFRKRSQKEKDSVYPDAVASTLAGLLPLIDNFERATQADCSDGEYKKGMEMIFKAFLEQLAKLHVEEFGAAGDAFDPTLHNAVMHCEDEEAGENTVTEVFQKGYRMGDRVLRVAMVKVAN